MAREIRVPIPKNELMYYDEATQSNKPIKVDPNGVLFVRTDGDSTAGESQFKGRVKNVTTAGTRVQLDNIPCMEVTIIAKKGNTGSIFIGGNDVTSSVYGAELYANESLTVRVNNSNLIYINSSVSGEGVSYIVI